MPQKADPGASRFINEVEHGKRLAGGVGEDIWGWKTPAGRLRAERRATLIMQGASVGPGSKVLEIGCGFGFLTEKFARSGADITAVDLSPDLLDIARARGLANVRFLEKNFEDCEVEGPFDAVIGSSILHHLELQRTWKKIYALLKPGGRMSFAEPNMLNPQIYCERHFRRYFPETSPDETAFVRFPLRRELEKNGFSSVEIQPFDWLHPFTPPALIPAVTVLGKVLEAIWPCREFSGSLWIRARRSS